MKKHYIWYLVLGVFILLAPTIIYLCFLIPQMSEEYNILMSSSGIIGGAGIYGSTKIPEKISNSKLLKLSATSFTLMTVLTLVEKFLMQIIGLVAVFIISYIIFMLLKGKYVNERRRKQNIELATEVARATAQNT